MNGLATVCVVSMRKRKDKKSKLIPKREKNTNHKHAHVYNKVFFTNCRKRFKNDSKSSYLPRYLQVFDVDRLSFLHLELNLKIVECGR